MHVHTLIAAANTLCVKMLFTLEPQLSSVQLLFVRGILGTTFSWLWANTSIIEIMWHSVPSGHFKIIFIRCMLNYITKLMMFYVVKHFKMTTY